MQAKPVKLESGHWFMTGCVTVIGESGYAVSVEPNDFTSFACVNTPGVSGSTSSHYYSETSFWYNEISDQIVLTIRANSRDDWAYADPELWGVTPDSQASMRPPIITPFDKNGMIDEKLSAKEMKICLDAGAHGVSVGGSTGEGSTLRDEELSSLIAIAKDFVREEQPIVCGIMRTCTRDAVKAGLAAKEAGADMLMVTPTAYNVLVPNEEAMFDFYSTISKEVELPIIIYNVIPQNTILPGLFKRLLDETDHVIGVKQSVGGMQAFICDENDLPGPGHHLRSYR